MISSNLKYYRARLGKTQAEIAALIGIPAGTYQTYETGRAEPSLHILVKLRNIFGLHSVEELINRDHTKEKEDLKSLLHQKYLGASEKSRMIVDLVLNITPAGNGKLIRVSKEGKEGLDAEKIIKDVRKSGEVIR
jgi:transcriptional regulator with XRE-family HTH domain